MNAVEPNVAGYTCPHCHRPLDVGDDRWQGWVLCPECGVPGLPPYRPRRTRRRVQEPVTPLVVTRANADPAIITPVQAGGGNLAPNVIARPTPASVSSAPRLIFTTGLFVSAFLLLIAYLEKSKPNTVVFGCLTLICFLALLRIPRTR